MWPYNSRRKPTEPETKWYAGVNCGACGSRVPWIEDPSRGKVKLIFESPLITLACPSCGTKANYPTKNIFSFPGESRPRQ